MNHEEEIEQHMAKVYTREYALVKQGLGFRYSEAFGRPIDPEHLPQAGKL